MDPQSTFAHLLRDLFWLWRSELNRRLAPLGLSQAQWQPLLWLYREERPMTQAELADRLQVESPTLVRLLDRLSSKGWVERRACPGDRRAHHVHLTLQARGVCAEIDRVVAEARTDLMKGVGRAELMRCNEMMTRLRQRAEALQALSLGEVPAANTPQNAAKRRTPARRLRSS